MSNRIVFAALCVWAFSPAASGQSGKAFFKEGEALREQNQLEQAIEKYTLAVQVDPKLLKAFQARADAYELLGKKAECAADRRAVADLDPQEPLHAAQAAKAYLEVGDAPTAIALCDQAIRVDAKCMDALLTKTRACLSTNNVDCAMTAADAALTAKATTDSYYMHGRARMAYKDFKTAEADFDRVIEWNHLYEPAYVAQAETQLELYQRYTGQTMQMRTLEKAIEKCTRALELNTMSTDALFTRSKAYAEQKEYAKAIDDVSRCIALGREDDAVSIQRAKYYHGFGQHQNAVNDLNKVLARDPKNVSVILLRSECREANLDLEGARRDLDAAMKELDADAQADPEQKRQLRIRRTELDQRIFEMNRESDPPYITVVEPTRKDDVAQVSSSLAHVKVTGHVRDRNFLKVIAVNGITASFAADEKDPEFFVSVPLAPSAKTIEVVATDIYENTASVTLRVERSENVPPVLLLTSPKATADRTITVPSDKSDIFLEGEASDVSGIRSISVDGVMTSFRPDTTATDFSMKLPLQGRSAFTVRAEDQYGNSTELAYTVKRKVETVVAEVPSKPSDPKPSPEKPKPIGGTGTTWVIFIENTNYKNLPALQGPESDVEKMRKAFAKYNVQKTITKKNLSKSQTERFFNIELRDMVRTNRVETILVWYAGHGKSANGKTYWVPVDGKKDDIYSFYNYTSLKSLMENYSESVRSTLVVSDAAGTDPSFYELTR